MASLTSSLSKVGAGTLASRLLGLARDLLIARLFGANGATDAFVVAFKIPNFARRLFAEGVFSTALVPVLSEQRAMRGDSGLRGFVDDMAGALGALLLVITGVGLLAAPWLILVFAPGFAADASQHEMATTMLRLTLPYILLITLTALAGSILNTYERFGVPAVTPALLNLVLIGCALWLAPRMAEPVLALAWGVLIAGFVQLGFQLPFLGRLGLLPRPRLDLKDPSVRRVFGQMGPAVLGVSVGQISLLLNTLMASFLPSGSISWLYYADRLMEFPLGVLAVTLGTVIMPRLSQRHVAQDPRDFSLTLDWALRWVVVLGFPAAMGLLALAEPLMATLLLSGAFDAKDVEMAATGLMAYAPAVPALMAVKVLVTGYYARQSVRTPVRVALIALAIGLLCNLLLIYPFDHVGLALATSTAAILNALLLLKGLVADKSLDPTAGWGRLLLRAMAASATMGTVILLGAGEAEHWIGMGSGARILSLAAWTLAGGLAYAVSLLVLGVRPRDLMRQT